MDLPNNEIGISDIIAWRDCPRRMSYSMQRWGAEEDPPEARSDATDYGTAMHYAFHLAGTTNMTDKEVVKETFNMYGQRLWPHHLIRLRQDLITYRQRDPTNVRLVGSEVNARVPILTKNGETIYFRGQIDRLYERLDKPGYFLHRDYKSSRWEKSQEEVDEDLQLWAYNFLIHEFWPECDNLLQTLDQVEFTEVHTRKSGQDRRHMREWLELQIDAILEDKSYREDGLLKPTLNKWCGTCSIVMDCPVIDQLSDFSQTRIQAEQSAMRSNDEMPAEKIQEYANLMEEAGSAKRVLENFEKTVKDLIKTLPEGTRAELGYELTRRQVKRFPSDALQEIHRQVGTDFYDLVSLSQKALSSHLTDDERLEPLLSLALSEPGTEYVKRKAQSRRVKDRS